MAIKYPPYVPTFGFGAPGSSVPVSQPYYDVSTSPYSVYVYNDGSWQLVSGTGGGVSDILTEAGADLLTETGNVLITES